MLSIGIRYLTGFSAAAEFADDASPEWPPHPARVFMALAAAHFTAETGDAAERAALLWCEGLGPPDIHASDADPRAVVTHYVPVPDVAGPSKSFVHSLPLTRERQPRAFVRCWPRHDTVWMKWTGADPSAEIRAALERLCARVSRLGHPSSLVQLWVGEPTPAPDAEPAWVCNEAAATRALRVVGEGALADLEQRFNLDAAERYGALAIAAEAAAPKERRLAKAALKSEFGNEPPPRLRPAISNYAGYAALAPASTKGAVAPSGDWSPALLRFALERVSGPYDRLGLECMPAICRRWHQALCAQCEHLPQRLAEALSGHAPGGSPSAAAHLAFLPLAFVGSEHADGHLLGVALALPATLAPGERGLLVRAVGSVRELKLGPLGVWRLVQLGTETAAANLKPDAWTGGGEGSTHWATVTPIAYDQHAKAKDQAAYHAEVAEMIAAACERVGLPAPCAVAPGPVSAHAGAPAAHQFPRMARKDGSQRRHCHARIAFAEPVRGPILLGAGRYRGYGVCRPLDAGTGA
ncbi:MAG: type I-G CRISPR-associated protein Csb2 [Terriglobales bacterium]